MFQDDLDGSDDLQCSKMTSSAPFGLDDTFTSVTTSSIHSTNSTVSTPPVLWVDIRSILTSMALWWPPHLLDDPARLKDDLNWPGLPSKYSECCLLKDLSMHWSSMIVENTVCAILFKSCTFFWHNLLFLLLRFLEVTYRKSSLKQISLYIYI